MNRTFAKRGLSVLVSVFFLFGALIFTATNAAAQGPAKQTQPGVRVSKSATTLVNQDEAVLRLGSAIQTIHANMPSLIPGSAAYNDALRHVYYYKQIAFAVQGGTSVDDAVYNSLAYLALGDGHVVNATPAQMQVLYNDAVSLLQ
ncbi:MAG: hypothetical protein IPH12_13590 [Saprospirales bacterium]|nr:hypothetical protein [Saprospirales bacterium]